MKAKFTLILLCAGLISGCHAYVHLYPVQGPLAALAPPPVYTAKVSLVPNWSKPVTVGSHANDKAGKISVALAEGESFDGTWKEVYEKAGTQSASAKSPGMDNLAGAWDAVYGSGYYDAHVLGTPLFVQTAITGSQGTVLTVEWFEQGYGTDDLVAKGVAKDSKGNVYKLVF
jgi:hypothetical protein